ncbi:velvet factor-domain-containing protein [Fennellomyces sp. T-0311]|nr:velvet factor-domain-containing protein [Fennellomyces sp. T-0311]
MQWLNCADDEIKKCLQSPFYFLVANIVTEDDPNTLLLPSQNYLSGSTVSSLYRLRDIDNSDGGFFVFGDLAVKKEGKYRLHFSLFEIVEGDMQNRKTLLSEAFTVYLPKRFPGPFEATFLSRTFCDQGVKMRIRKEHRLPSVSGRKRRVENMKQAPPNEETAHATRPYKRKTGYVDNGQNQDVHFGRWQSALPHHPNQGNPTVDTKPPSPSQQQQQQQQSIASSNDFLPSPATQYSSSVSIDNVHRNSATQSIPSPPPTSVQQHFSSDLAGYHFDKMGHNNYLALSRQLTPPPILADIERHPHRYSDRLPPLRMIMGDMVGPSSLPPPASLVGTSRVSINQLLSSPLPSQ